MERQAETTRHEAKIGELSEKSVGIPGMGKSLMAWL
jgi:hypothetical protein